MEKFVKAFLLVDTDQILIIYIYIYIFGDSGYDERILLEALEYIDVLEFLRLLILYLNYT